MRARVLASKRGGFRKTQRRRWDKQLRSARLHQQTQRVDPIKSTSRDADEMDRELKEQMKKFRSNFQEWEKGFPWSLVNHTDL
eukprot:g31853.t1